MSNFNKSNLQTGHVVELRNGDRCTVMLRADFKDVTHLNYLVNINSAEIYPMHRYCEDMTNDFNNTHDIMKVYRVQYGVEDNKTLLYERKEAIDLIRNTIGEFKVEDDTITIEGFTIDFKLVCTIGDNNNIESLIEYVIHEVNCNSEIDHGEQPTLQDAVKYVMTKLAEKEG